MTEPDSVRPQEVAAAPAEEPGFALDPAVVEAAVDALDRDDRDALQALLQPLTSADTADLVQSLSGDRRRRFVSAMRGAFDGDILAELDERVRDEVIAELGVEETAQAVAELETDDAVLVISELDKEDQQQVLEAMPPADRALIEEALAYPDYSAGRLMRREMVVVATYWTVGATIDFLREEADNPDSALPEDFYDVFVVDPGFRPVGVVPLSRLLRGRRPVPVTDIMDAEMKVIPAETDQEDVAFLFRQRNLTSAPVVDDAGRLVGAITIDDVVDVIDEEHEDDIMRLGGVVEDDLYSATVDTARARFSWLLVNMLTAILASVVIGLFEASLEQMVALAVLMPIVASMGGNAGTQTLTVAVRALATHELTPANALRVIGKELLVGALNGVLFAVIAAGVAWIWFGDPSVALVIALAMIVNLIAAALAGAAIPLLLERYGVDPAVASSVFVTTVTDCVGFFAFLGLASWLIL
jgi:magnesium transporter